MNFNFENINKLTDEQQKILLKKLIENDVSYWKKVITLLSMGEENKEFLDFIIENKRKEIEYFNSIYKFKVKSLDLEDILKISSDTNYIETMEKIVTNDILNAKACTQVMEILKLVSQEYVDKINPKFLDNIRKNSSASYKFEIYENDKFEELNILKETKEILSIISSKYWNIDNISEVFDNK